MRWPTPKILSFVMLAALAGAGCLITDPILPIDSSTNQAPTFRPNNPNPATSPALQLLPGSTTPITFRAEATDDQTNPFDLIFEWRQDATVVSGPAANDSTYSTNAAQLGPGTHTLAVRIVDTGTPPGELDATWTINVQ